MSRVRARSLLVALLIALLAIGSWVIESRPDEPPRSTAVSDPAVTATASPSGRTDPDSGLPWISPDALPVQAQKVLFAIEAGGPFAYSDKDGSTFGNYEGLLPPEPRGYYAEYTVPTPGESDRGPRRVIAGDGGERYWTADHYASFARVRPPAG